uniref:NADH-ubiquinone oxidoreductase chain 5 n=1 Tax=Arachnocampa flava TaxID=270899 RepID=G8J8F8_9DIPT|nr:NADH dehydrogenase subunit 5 [Arachnocampa flava]AET13076.1 NADH dehydrogenase subunit 5 [Arachnocampa flava]
MDFISICFISLVLLMILSIVFLLMSLNFLFFNLIYLIEWEIISLNSTSVVMTLLLDWMSLMFMSFVLLISSVVIYYSKDYMSHDYNINRFIMIVLMFVLSMMLLIISPNLISILLGWDGLGLVSYCLVIYFQNTKSYNAGMITALSNRVGDVALLMAIAWMMNFGSWNYIFYLEIKNQTFLMMIIGSLIILAGMTKSAQIPFSSWLPAAMAAPTPVSALVHSSTLVTAGVYLLIRFNIIFLNNYLGQLLLLISGLTMFMSSMGANLEFDLKKIIALSTLSQLSLMMMILSLGFMKLAFFHLLMHALFKALLFMCAGSMIHNLMNFQDIRMMGSLCKMMPLTSTYFNISNLALCGMPFLAGFYSKDLILEMVILSNVNKMIFFFFFFSTGLTVSYSFRLIYYSMIKIFNLMSLYSLNDESLVMLKSMMILLIMSIIGGSIISWLIFPVPSMICLPLYLKVLVLLICLMGGLMGYLISMFFYYKMNYLLKNFMMKMFFGSMWFMPIISTLSMIFLPLMMGKKLVKEMDQGWSEWFGGQGLYLNMKNMSQYFQFYQNNNLKIYMLMFILWFFIIFFFVF